MKYLKEYRIFEYLKKDENIWLYKYLKMTDEQKKDYLPHEYPWFFNDFIEDENIEFKVPTNNYIDYEGKEQIGEEYNDYEIPEWLETHNKELFNKFREWLYKRVINSTLEIPDNEYPTWSFFDKPKIIKDQWLIHFTDNSQDIEREGFTKGTYDIDKLGLTTHTSSYGKEHGGYNFCYTIYDFKRYAKSWRGWQKGYKYGKEAVLFRCSGVRARHNSDEEYQTIFWGNLAKNINAIESGEKKQWGIYNRISGRLLYENDELEKVIDWFVNNYNQYKKYLN
jgi:hypothetical protein